MAKPFRTLRFLGCHFPENKRIPSASYVIRATTAQQEPYEQVIATERSDAGHTAGGVFLFHAIPRIGKEPRDSFPRQAKTPREKGRPSRIGGIGSE